MKIKIISFVVNPLQTITLFCLFRGINGSMKHIYLSLLNLLFQCAGVHWVVVLLLIIDKKNIKISKGKIKRPDKFLFIVCIIIFFYFYYLIPGQSMILQRNVNKKAH